jgi:hypothetical protein
MKIQRWQTIPSNESGMATLVFIVLLAIMMILVTAESRALIHLDRELKILERQQVKRLNTTGNSQTNGIANAVLQIK